MIKHTSYFTENHLRIAVFTVTLGEDLSLLKYSSLDLGPAWLVGLSVSTEAHIRVAAADIAAVMRPRILGHLSHPGCPNLFIPLLRAVTLVASLPAWNPMEPIYPSFHFTADTPAQGKGQDADSLTLMLPCWCIGNIQTLYREAKKGQLKVTFDCSLGRVTRY